MKVMLSLIILFLTAYANAQSLEAMGYEGIGSGDLYRAINWIRNVSNSSHTPEPSSWTQESRVGDTLFIDGEVQGIQWSMLRNGEYKGVKRVVINSYGGLVEGARELAQVIRNQGLDTVVPAGGVCMSACTLIFQAGINRMAHESAIFMYHPPRSGRIGMANLNRQCQLQGSDYCNQRIEELINGARDTADDFFNEYNQYGLSSDLARLIFSLPEEPEEDWREDGNWLKKVDLVFGADATDPRLSRLNQFEIMPLEELERLNVVTAWFDYDVGWETDRTIEAENPYSTP